MDPYKLENVPNQRNWVFPQIDGVPTGWATIPPGEVRSIVEMVQYLTIQLASCNAIRTKPATP